MPSRKLALALLASAGLVLLLGACKPTCTVEELQAPIDLDPNSDSDVFDPESLVDFYWGYPDTECEPDFFEMYVWTGVEPESPGMTGRIPFDSPPSPGEWHLAWPQYFEAGNSYFWRQAACLEIGPGDDPCGPSSLGHFFIGPVCTDPDEMQPVDLISPADDATFAAADDILFAWDDPTECLVDGLFEIQISKSPTFADYEYRVPILQTRYTIAGADIPLEECTRYYWRVKTDPSGPPEEPFSASRSFYVHTPGYMCLIGIEPVPWEPWVTVPVDTNCRKGPSTRFGVDDTAFAGVPLEVRARNADGSWLQVMSANLGHVCWIYPDEAPVDGDLGKVPVLEIEIPEADEPTHTPWPFSCGRYTDQKSCVANSACTWKNVGAVAPVYKCVDK